MNSSKNARTNAHTNAQTTPLPAPVADLLQACQSAVQKMWNLKLDLTPETLPAVDQYLREIPAGAAADVQRLAISAAGCYFGEVVRLLLDGRWRTVGDDPRNWRIELRRCFLHFSPVAMAGEVCSRGQDADYDGGFLTNADQHGALENMLRAAAPLSEDEYYSLCGRLETLQMVADWLVNRQLSEGEEPHEYSAKDYVLAAHQSGQKAPPRGEDKAENCTPACGCHHHHKN